VWFLNQQFLKGRIKTIDELRAAVIKLTESAARREEGGRGKQQGLRR
jgi:hypothetical protein